MKDEALAGEAIEWFLKVDREEPTLETLAAWQQWLEQSPRHRAEYEATQRTWRALDGAKPTVARRRNLPKWAAILAAAAVLALVTIYLHRSPMYSQDVATDIGEHREILLPDHSRIQVGAHSSLQLNYSAQRREIRLLAGEAFFSVAHDPLRPFVVDAGLSKVTAVGTAFNVRRYRDSVAVEVAEGRVRLEKAAADLTQGKEAFMDISGNVRTVRSLPAQNVAAWRTGRHSYIDEPLGTVIADLNRYSTRPIRVQDPTLAGLRITTTFFSDDWQGWLNTLQSAVPAVQIRSTPDDIRISMHGARSDQGTPD